MDCFELMVEEHKNIKRMLLVIRKYCSRILNREEVQYEDFYKIIDFVRGYADRHHHGKEETLLFNRMMEELGPIAEKLVRYGMNIEHDMGRLYMEELEAAVKRVLEGDAEARLDVIANAISYTHLLNRHIDKEDEVVYQFAKNKLAKETLEKLDADCAQLEEEARDTNLQGRYLSLIDQLEAKVRGDR